MKPFHKMQTMKVKKCKIDGCDKKYFGLGFCNMHYSRQRHGITDMRPEPISSKGTRWAKDHPRRRENIGCSVINCNDEHYAKSYCRTHYNLNRRNGAPIYKKVFPKPTCMVSGCLKESIIKGFCKFHYGRHLNGTDLHRPKGIGGELNYNWKGGVSEYPNHYELKKNRLIVLENSNWVCKYCGGKADRVHHRDKTKRNHKLNNLAPSCATCNSQRMDENNRRYFVSKYGMSSIEISRKTGLSRNELNTAYDNNKLKNILLSYDDINYGWQYRNAYNQLGIGG